MTSWKKGLEADSQSLQQPWWNATQKQDAETHIAGIEQRLAALVTAREKKAHDKEAREKKAHDKDNEAMKLVTLILILFYSVYDLYKDIRLLYQLRSSKQSSIYPNVSAIPKQQRLAQTSTK